MSLLESYLISCKNSSRNESIYQEANNCRVHILISKLSLISMDNFCQLAKIPEGILFESRQNNCSIQESNSAAQLDSESERMMTICRSSEIKNDDIAIDDQKCTLNVPSLNNVYVTKKLYERNESNIIDKEQLLKNNLPNQICTINALGHCPGVPQMVINNQISPAILYIYECLNKRLLPSAHYSILSITWMNENDNYVIKDINPPNVPQRRYIENFWIFFSSLKNVKFEKENEGGWQASTEQQLINRIRLKFCEIPYGEGQSSEKSATIDF
ncbi:glucosylceramidase 4 [Brachionus plicatilis]|uniref:Glucosylceramidase 4 n=1 Tax=Brachionus plicatilis TaxID=10195 RepID=A0A3M7SXC1_BRAPC|nr:glucosylceramidase 4 [Brachionus plicatilis]